MPDQDPPPKKPLFVGWSKERIEEWMERAWRKLGEEGVADEIKRYRDSLEPF